MGKREADSAAGEDIEAGVQRPGRDHPARRTSQASSRSGCPSRGAAYYPGLLQVARAADIPACCTQGLEARDLSDVGRPES